MPQSTEKRPQITLYVGKVAILFASTACYGDIVSISALQAVYTNVNVGSPVRYVTLTFEV